MKSLTLNQTWTRCTRMWREVIKLRKKDRSIPVCDLKKQCLKKLYPKDYDDNMWADCYFCDYAITHNCHKYPFSAYCSRVNGPCPGKMLSPKFDCENTSYNWFDHPIAFLRKIEQLNKQRLAKAKKGEAMTTPCERTSAIQRTIEFLEDVAFFPVKAPNVPMAVRDRAKNLLRHFPTDAETSLIKWHDSPEQPDPDHPPIDPI